MAGKEEEAEEGEEEAEEAEEEEEEKEAKENEEVPEERQTAKRRNFSKASNVYGVDDDEVVTSFDAQIRAPFSEKTCEEHFRL